MRPTNRNTRIALAAASLLGGLIFVNGTAAAAQISADGWQSLQPARSGKAQSDRALLASVATPSATTAQVPDAQPVATSSTVAEAAPVAGEPFRLVKGEPLQMQLQRWAARAGWTVVWNVPDGWIVPGDRSYGTDFEAAVQRAVEELASNGADVVGDSWRGNRTVIISQNGVIQ